MLINNDEADKRLGSPLNLINKLNSARERPAAAKSAMQLFGIARHTIPDAPAPQSDNDKILGNIEHKIKIELAHTAALDTLVSTVERLKLKIPEMDNATKLADVAAKMSKIVETLDDKRSEGRGKEEQVHYHFYMPEQKDTKEYEVIDVN